MRDADGPLFTLLLYSPIDFHKTVGNLFHFTISKLPVKFHLR